MSWITSPFLGSLGWGPSSFKIRISLRTLQASLPTQCYVASTVWGAYAVLGTENKCTICEGERPKKENAAIKYEKKWCMGGIRYQTGVCSYAPLFCLYSGIVPPTACCRPAGQGAPQD